MNATATRSTHSAPAKRTRKTAAATPKSSVSESAQSQSAAAKLVKIIKNELAPSARTVDPVTKAIAKSTQSAVKSTVKSAARTTAKTNVTGKAGSTASPETGKAARI